MRRFAALVAFAGLMAASWSASASGRVYSFGVLNQRSITLSAEYWNPILRYVSAKSGVALRLRMARTAPETSAMIGRAEFDFVYSNTVFTPANEPAGYQVFARPMEDAIRGQLVALDDAPVRDLKDLEGKEVGFPSLAAFMGYAVPMNALLQAGVTVKPVFAGNQEGIMGQLKTRRVMAAGVNSQVMREFAQREGVKYRVLWSSEPYLNLPLSALPSVEREVVAAVSAAFLGMGDDPEGRRILAASAALIGQKPPYGFVPASNREYRNYHTYYMTTKVKGL